MEVVMRRKRSSGLFSPLLLMVVACVMLMMMMIPEVSCTRFIVGGNRGWSPNTNCTVWAKDKHFYLGDWLFFVYDRAQNNVLEVNKTNYESCISENPIHSWTTGAGRDVVPLNVTRNYYFISGNGFCFSGMKIAIHVEKVPPPPTASPTTHKNGSPSVSGRVTRTALAFVELWNFLGNALFDHGFVGSMEHGLALLEG